MSLDPKGGLLVDSCHEVKTLRVAREWYPNTVENDLPIRVAMQTASNGRFTARITNQAGKLLVTRG